ncbi:LicD family protein [bacterium]|nr:LicD family protein [bacterium]
MKQENKHIIFNFLGIKLKIKNPKYPLFKEMQFQKKLIIDNIDITKLKPITGELRKDQLLCLNILQRTKKICDTNNLKYWLDSGTLLGAFRHKGFIPWDDDIDLCMLREDYNKILPLLKEEFKNDNNFYLREKAFKSSCFQIRIRHKEKNVGLDIFPVDFYTKSKLTDQEKKDITNKIKKATKILKKKYKNKKINNEKIIEEKKEMLNIQNKIVLNNQKVNCENPALFFGIDFPSDAKELVFENNIVFPLKEIEFEGKIYLAPNNTEAYLKNFYSNYMEYPVNFIRE